MHNGSTVTRLFVPAIRWTTHFYFPSIWHLTWLLILNVVQNVELYQGDGNDRFCFMLQLLSPCRVNLRTHTYKWALSTHTTPALEHWCEKMLIDRLVTTRSLSRGVGSCSALIHPALTLSHSLSFTHALTWARFSSLVKHKHSKHMVILPCTVPRPIEAF